MDLDRKILLEEAMAAWKAKGNARLAEACAIALEGEPTKSIAEKISEQALKQL